MPVEWNWRTRSGAIFGHTGAGLVNSVALAPQLPLWQREDLLNSLNPQ